MRLAVADAYEHCRQVTKHHAKTFYRGAHLLQRHKRLAAWALYAFCRTVDDMVDHASTPADALAGLALWRDRLLKVYDGQPTDAITLAWHDMLQHYDVPLQPALDLIDGVQMDLEHTWPSSFDELRLYCYRVAGTVGLLMSPILGYASPAALPHAVDLGIAMQLTNILRDIGEDAQQGRIYLPRAEMDQFGYRKSDLLAGRINAPFIALMRYQITRAHEYYERARPGIDMLDTSGQFAILASASWYRGILGAIEANGYDVFTRRAHVSLTRKMQMLPRLWWQLHTRGMALPLAPSDDPAFSSQEYDGRA